MFGLSPQDYNFILETLSTLLNRGVKVWCFGSRARGNHFQFSDLDLMLEHTEDLTREIGQIKEILEESRLPIKVDLVQEKNFAHSYRDTYLRDRKPFV